MSKKKKTKTKIPISKRTGVSLRYLAEGAEQSVEEYLAELVQVELMKPDDRLKKNLPKPVDKVEIKIHDHAFEELEKRYPMESQVRSFVARIVNAQAKKRPLRVRCHCGCGTWITSVNKDGRPVWFADKHGRDHQSDDLRDREVLILKIMISEDREYRVAEISKALGDRATNLYRSFSDLVSIGFLDRVRQGVYRVREDAKDFLETNYGVRRR